MMCAVNRPDRTIGYVPEWSHIQAMSRLHRILSILLLLGLALGTTAQAVQMGRMAGMPDMAASAAAMDHGAMPGCENCPPVHGKAKGMEMAGCQGGVCIVLPGLLPALPASPSIAPDAFAAGFPHQRSR